MVCRTLSRSILLAGLSAMSVFWLASCGSHSRKTRGKPAIESFSLSVLEARPESSGADPQFALAADPTFTGRIVGCASGLELVLNEANTTTSLSSGDTGCNFRLDQLTTGGQTFDFSGVPLSSWQAGSVFSLRSREGTQAEFRIRQQITSPVSGPQQAAIAFTFVSQGGGIDALPTVQTSIALAGPYIVPLASQRLDVYVSNATATLGFGVFTLDLSCSASGGTTISGTQYLCGGVDLGALRSGLQTAPADVAQISLEGCRDIALKGTTGGKAGTPFASGSGGFTTGGLRTAAHVGPGKLYDRANATLALAVAGTGADDGCKLFVINVSSAKP